MTEQDFNQLRFDICESVRLHTQQPSMGTLLELDLCPDVEIKDKGNHLKIEGFLRLKGAYLTEEASDVEREEQREDLSYVIPVEITLPADRAEMQHVSAEIESFDYQMLSPFELQIDAILLIDGLIPEKHVEEVSMEEEIPMFSGAEAMNEELRTHSPEDSTEELQAQLKPVDSPPISEEVEQVESEPIQHQMSEEREEVEKEPVEQIDARDVEEDHTDHEQSALDEHEQEENGLESKEWATWLVGEKEEDFTSFRIVIVQDESVQQLADRYEIPPSKIRQVNDLAEEELVKGQVLYIPK